MHLCDGVVTAEVLDYPKHIAAVGVQVFLGDFVAFARGQDVLREFVGDVLWDLRVRQAVLEVPVDDFSTYRSNHVLKVGCGRTRASRGGSNCWQARLHRNLSIRQA